MQKVSMGHEACVGYRTMASLTAGTRIKDYEVWGKIGGGGMSEVWLARHSSLAIPLIMKTLRSDLIADPQSHFTRLMNEARLMARVQSHRVVKALDLGVENGIPYLVQEYIDGIDVNEVDKLRRSGLGLGLPLWFVCETVAHIAEGLIVAHRSGVIHRDVKPSNVFCSPSLGTKLGDFGVAMIQGRDMEEVSGTLTFMSPEALRGECIDRRADIFALGATAYDLRYGHSPFCEISASDRAKQRFLPVFPTARSGEEAFFQHLVNKMLSPDAGERFSDLNVPLRSFETLASNTKSRLRVAKLSDGNLFVQGTKIICEIGDISKAKTDGIVSSSSPTLVTGTAVGEALARAAGQEFVDEVLGHGIHPLGSCVVTGPGQLACKKVIHAVSAWDQVSCIARSVQRALLLAEKEGLRSLAIPALGTGTARVSIEASAAAQAEALRWHFRLGGTQLREVRFVLVSESKLQQFREVVESIFLESHNPAKDEIGLDDLSKKSLAHRATELVHLPDSHLFPNIFKPKP
jgi:eukaryotic-like serine/threonine-protein kinase